MNREFRLVLDWARHRQCYSRRRRCRCRRANTCMHMINKGKIHLNICKPCAQRAALLPIWPIFFSSTAESAYKSWSLRLTNNVYRSVLLARTYIKWNGHISIESIQLSSIVFVGLDFSVNRFLQSTPDFRFVFWMCIVRLPHVYWQRNQKKNSHYFSTTIAHIYWAHRFNDALHGAQWRGNSCGRCCCY